MNLIEKMAAKLGYRKHESYAALDWKISMRPMLDGKRVRMTVFSEELHITFNIVLTNEQILQIYNEINKGIER